VPEQAARRAQRLEKPGYQRSEGQRDKDEPADQLHREIGGTDDLNILTGQTDEGES
jgi:hypothetical protein